MKARQCNYFRTALIVMAVVLTACLGRAIPASAAALVQTDVGTPAAGNELVGVEGTYSSPAKETILERINAIRKEACDQGVMNPNTRKPLTAADYVPIRWSSDLEMIAQLRAAEATVYQSHTRPNGTSCFSLQHNGTKSWSETIAWNYSGMMDGIDQWYEEKADWVNGTGGVTGHYTALIAPGNKYVGLGTFQRKSGGWAATVGEFSSKDGLDETKSGFTGECIRVMEVSKDSVSAPAITGTMTINPGASTELTYAGTVSYQGIMGGTNKTTIVPFGAETVWQSSDPKIATVTASGVVTAVTSGEVTITAQNASMGTASCVVTVAAPKKGMKVVSGNAEYVITKAQKTVKLNKWKTASGNITIPASIKINGKSYKVTAIEKNAFKGNRAITGVTIGKNIEKIGSQAFYGCKSLKTIKIKTTKLTSKSVGSKAFKGIQAKATIKVPAKALKNYKKLLKAKGVGGKVKIKK